MLSPIPGYKHVQLHMLPLPADHEEARNGYHEPIIPFHLNETRRNPLKMASPCPIKQVEGLKRP